MGNPKKIPIGQRLKSFPAGTVNALVEGELRDRARRGTVPPPPVNAQRSSVIVRLHWTGAAQLPAGHVVKLGEAIFDPTDDTSAPFTGLQFKCSQPADGDADAHVAITPAPIEADAVGFGAIPQAVWAKVDVIDEAHEFAAVVDATLLESATTGRFPIIWKPAGTGEKWAVVSIGGAGAAPPLVEGILIKNIDAATVALTFDGADITAATKTPGAVEEEAVIVFEFAEGAEPGDAMTAKLNDDDSVKLYDAVNYASWDPLRAGNGDGDGVETPLWVLGYISTREVTVGEETERQSIFVILHADNPIRLFRGTTTAAVAAAAWDSDGLERLHGRKLSDDTTTIEDIENPDNWDGDDGAYNLFVEKPDGERTGIDLACPE